MFPLFHIAVPLFVSEIPKLKKKYRFNRFFLILGSMFPDIVDKTILLLKLGSGRLYFHSLLFVFLSFGLLYLISKTTTKNNTQISVSFLIGMLFHLVLDLPDVPLFFPFIPYDVTIIDDPIPMWFNTLLTDPIVQITEITGAGILTFLIIKNKLYKTEELLKYLKTEPIYSTFLEKNSSQKIQIVED
ncbi:MAG: metal-dependent hydrolase [Promethearchaeota archaeon]|nr:MAG: metal-dependent hydrolase [Candidatus Lokiarchaeota archaeon]